jgi:hypothetical protein
MLPQQEAQAHHAISLRASLEKSLQGFRVAYGEP